MNDFSITKDRRVFLDGTEVKGVLGFRVLIEAGKNPEVELRVSVGSIAIDGYTDVFKGAEEPVLALDREAMARYFTDRHSGASTKELVDELRTRDGVETHVVGPNASMTVEAEGPAIILSVID